MGLWERLFGAEFLLPSGYYPWGPALIWLHVLSGCIISLSCFSFALALIYFARRRQDSIFNRMFLLLGIFILACGTTHLMEIWNFWHASFWSEGLVKLVTAITSVATIGMLWPLIPKALSLPAPAQVEKVDLALNDAIDERERLRQEADELNKKLDHCTRQLGEANRELESFSYSVSHDLRAPMRSINGFSRALLEDHAEGLDPMARDYLNRVAAASRRMGEMIEGLLKLSRISREELRPTRIDLTGMAGGIAGNLQASEPGRSVTFVIAPDLSAEADPNLTRVVLENLIGNAWKFSGEEANARIEVGRVAREGQGAYFVSDNGAGFDMEYAGKLFAAFQRLHGEARFQGTGIGLAHAARVIHRHGGRIWAEAELGRGATFYFTLSAEEGNTA